MKTLYRHILKSFAGPLVLTLAIALFVLLMQFLFMYIDDLVGKGLSTYTITKLMVLATVTLIPMALPLAILFASIMTFGNLAENHELVCMKSAGLSLPKIVSPLVVFVFGISVAAFFFANNVLPVVNLKMGSLLYDIRTKKPALSIRQDVFYNGIDGYSIRIGKKDPNQETIHNIMIYDHTANDGDVAVTLAKSGKMSLSADKRYLVVTLDSGQSYQDMLQRGMSGPSHPMVANHFQQQTIYFDLSSFKFSRTNEALFKHNYQMLDMKQLTATSDSMKKRLALSKNEFYTQLSQTYLTCHKDTRRKNYMLHLSPVNAGIDVLNTAINIARNAKEYTEVSANQFGSMNDDILRREIEWQRKITFSFACFILFLIGAPLGAIIKKGGLGMPVVVSALFFILFYILSITGEKFAREQVTSVFVGMWMPSFILFPIGVFFTYKAAMDSALFDREAYFSLWSRFIHLFKKKKVI